jgi:hypothetical protein
MSVRRLAIAGALIAAFAAGELAEAPAEATIRTIGGYHVLAADFHVHSHPWSWGTLSPWDTVIEARRQGLDVVAMTPHNHVWVAKMGQWYSRLTGGPMVLVGEEIASADYHLIAVGIREPVPARQPAAEAIAAVHAQGGIAIAAHPYKNSWPAWDQAAMAALDGAEVVRPEAQHDEGASAQLREFFGRASLAAIASSDYHGIGTIGYCRTFVFVRERTEAEILAAVREGRTVVYGRERAYGDAGLIALAAQQGLDRGVPDLPAPGALKIVSRLAALLALAGALLVGGVVAAEPAGRPRGGSASREADPLVAQGRASAV